MKIYTKTGDQGTTSLVGGKRVFKNDPRVEAYGDADELISYLGLIIAESENPANTAETATKIRKDLLRIQQVLMKVSAFFAMPEEGTGKALKPMEDEEITFLEQSIDEMTGQIPPLKAFVIPGAPIQAAHCHVARTICRRVERRSINLHSTDQDLENNLSKCKQYLNRLSDYLFTLARFFNTVTSTPEVFWLP
ncbi:MAG: cob(I)yrinic acid a,c-diamide adenosyltransferase [Bacteroidales bacterium]|nr:cob(I)yrinic acid a,c-diamide adenosyltransferase [Bacteroidales bacterium]